jgi:hypothetical protein
VTVATVVVEMLKLEELRPFRPFPMMELLRIAVGEDLAPPTGFALTLLAVVGAVGLGYSTLVRLRAGMRLACIKGMFWAVTKPASKRKGSVENCMVSFGFVELVSRDLISFQG